MSSIFGGSKQKSSNQAYGGISEAFSPLYGQAQQGADAYSAFMGGDTSGFNNYKQNTGFDRLLGQGLTGITGAAAANGTLRSGSTGKAYYDYGQGLENSFADNYLQRLLGQSNIGFQAGQTVSGAGNISSGSSNSGGLGKFIGTALTMAPMLSDRRAKTDIEKIGVNSDGLNIYTFKYIFDDETVHTGVMAQEVAELMPEALGPVVDGYMTVDYSKLGEMKDAR